MKSLVILFSTLHSAQFQSVPPSQEFTSFNFSGGKEGRRKWDHRSSHMWLSGEDDGFGLQTSPGLPICSQCSNKNILLDYINDVLSCWLGQPIIMYYARNAYIITFMWPNAVGKPSEQSTRLGLTDHEREVHPFMTNIDPMQGCWNALLYLEYGFIIDRVNDW